MPFIFLALPQKKPKKLPVILLWKSARTRNLHTTPTPTAKAVV